MSTAQAWLVQVEYKHLQTYLFKVPKLKAMLGANALVGETLRGQFNGEAFVAEKEQENLLALTVGKARLPDRVSLTIEKKKDDPLDQSGKDQDDPTAAYKCGILSRDGGHLNVVFATDDEAKEFITAARELVGRKLPGLPLSAKLFPLTCANEVWTRGKEDAFTVKAQADAEDVLQLPQFQVCEITGLEPAYKQKPDRDNRKYWTSHLVEKLEKKATAFDRAESRDVLGLLRDSLCKQLKIPQEIRESNIFPNDFENAAPSGYLAVIVADGNNVGVRSSKWRENASSSFFAGEAHGEQFFYSMRVTVRKAVLTAIVATFGQEVTRIVQQFEELKATLRLDPNYPDKEIEPLSFRLMMLGGDDLLLVCDAVYAIPFALHYTAELKKETLPDGAPLDVGIGIAIVKSKFPFHRSHALAEQLQASAKRLYRALPAGKQESTIDWLAISEAWHEDVAEVRRQDAMRTYHNGQANETIVLSRRPYTIATLKELWDGTVGAVEHLPRNQLMALVEEIEKGRRQADFAVQLLGDKRARGLASVMADPKEISTIWQEHENNTHSTSLLDFLELYELRRMLNERTKKLTQPEEVSS